ncbi:hypothetical protein K438DRAFT_1851828 [Mycena galopus ATCC 62051]|nr:hypothetical protein K438DRAFT_1851828 [Mycena galopus ATCC 62051]
MVLAWISSWGIWRLMTTRSTATRMGRWTMMPTPTRASTPTSATLAMCGSRTTVPAAARVRFLSTSNSTWGWGWGWRATAAAARSRWPLRLGTSGCRWVRARASMTRMRGLRRRPPHRTCTPRIRAPRGRARRSGTSPRRRSTCTRQRRDTHTRMRRPRPKAMRLRPGTTHCRQRATPPPTRPARRNATVARTMRATPRRIRPRARRARRAARARWCCLRPHATLTLAGCRTSGALAPPLRPPASMNTTGRISTGCTTRMGTVMCITGTVARPRRRDTRTRLRPRPLVPQVRLARAPRAHPRLSPPRPRTRTTSSRASTSSFRLRASTTMRRPRAGSAARAGAGGSLAIGAAARLCSPRDLRLRRMRMRRGRARGR